jgi:hypothetical protein
VAFTVFRRFFGGAVNTASGYAIGGAMQPTLDPLTQDLANRTWALHPDRPIDPYALAEGVAQGQAAYDFAQPMAAASGISKENFDHLIDIANIGPGVSTAFDLWRRGVIDEAGFRRAVVRDGLEAEWIDDLVKVKQHLLSPEVIANAVQQGHVPNDGILPPIVSGATPLDIPLTQIDIDPLEEAAGSGVGEDRLRVLANLAGLPPPQGELLSMWNRGIITEAAVDAGIREGHTKTKWVAAVKEMAKAVLSPAEAAGLRLRGWITAQESYAIGAKHGYSQQQMDQLFLNRGRPATTHQIHIGYARGATVQGAANEEDAIRQSVQRSDIRPEYADVLYASRYTLPSAFALRGLVQSGDLTGDEGRAILVQSGWPPDLAEKVATSWATPSTAGASENPYVAKADTQLWTALHKAYVKIGAARTDVEPILEVLIPASDTRGTVFARWDDERKANTLEPPAVA